VPDLFFLPDLASAAARLPWHAQAIARGLLIERAHRLSGDIYLAYTHKRFQACRFGLDGELVDPIGGTRRPIGEGVAATLGLVAVHARELEAEAALEEIGAALREGNDARWMRERYAESRSLLDLVWRQVERLREGR
jgi:carboxylate-amine ligase